MSDENEKGSMSRAACALADMMGPEMEQRCQFMQRALSELLPGLFDGIDDRALFAMYCAGMKDCSEKNEASGRLMHEVSVALMAGAMSDLSDAAGISAEQLDAALARQREKLEGERDEHPQH